MKKKTLWTRNYTTVFLATVFGCIGGIMSGFALSFTVFEETSSTLAAALTVALRLIPGFLIPLLISPIMDRLPRKPFLVGADVVGTGLYLVAGLWLKSHEFDYVLYLAASLLIAAVGAFDELSYNAIFPKIIPAGMEEKGYAVSSMLYPMLSVILMPLSAVAYKTLGLANILLIQSGLSFLATATESTIRIREEIKPGTRFSLRQWWQDIREAAAYFKREKGLTAMTVYSGTSNGFFSGYEPLLVAFFSTAPGLNAMLYGFFTVAEFIGRTVGGLLLVKREIPKERKYGYALSVYLFYDSMDACLLWLPYPLMLVNRCVCGFLGIQSGTMRYAATQKYIPDAMRARVSAFQSMAFLLFSAVLSLLVGWMGEVMDYRLVMTICGAASILVCLLTIVRQKRFVEKIYLTEITKKEEET